MKLLFCQSCTDIFSLRPDIEKSCSCGKTKGKYIDNLQAEYSGEGIPLGLRNGSFLSATKAFLQSGQGIDFVAFVIAKDCETFKKVEDTNSGNCQYCGTPKDNILGLCTKCHRFPTRYKK